MKILNNERKSKKLIGEKLREARMEDRSPMTEEDAEYYRILAEARINYAEKKNARGYARRRCAANGLLVCLILAVACGGYILGMKADVSASADPDDERKVVQQGDNIGTTMKKYKSIEEIPLDVLNNMGIIDDMDVSLMETVVTITEKEFIIDTLYYGDKNIQIEVCQKEFLGDILVEVVEPNKEEKCEYKGGVIYKEECDSGIGYSYFTDNIHFDIFISEEAINIKIEDILDDLLN